MNHEPSQTTTDSSSRRIHFRRRAFGILMALIPAVMIAPLSACAWKPEIVRADPTLTSRDLVNGKIAIMPVKFDNDKATPKERYRTVSGLRRAVQQLREDIPVMSNPTLNKALEGSLEEEAVMLRIYDITGSYDVIFGLFAALAIMMLLLVPVVRLGAAKPSLEADPIA